MGLHYKQRDATIITTVEFLKGSYSILDAEYPTLQLIIMPKQNKTLQDNSGIQIGNATGNSTINDGQKRTSFPLSLHFNISNEITVIKQLFYFKMFSAGLWNLCESSKMCPC